MSDKNEVTLDNFLSTQDPINSPRSLDALQQLVIDPQELYPVYNYIFKKIFREMEDITAMEPDPDIAKEMYDHFEVVRKSIALY